MPNRMQSWQNNPNYRKTEIDQIND